MYKLKFKDLQIHSGGNTKYVSTFRGLTSPTVMIYEDALWPLMDMSWSAPTCLPLKTVPNNITCGTLTPIT